MKTLIIGAGEIGKSLCVVLSEEYRVTLIDKDGLGYPDSFEMIHICFPYSENFIQQVKEYKERFNPKYVVIHSTVPVGTSSQCNAWHSPVIGIHPNLENGLKTFDKFLGGKNVKELIDYFRKGGIKIYPVDKPEYTELMKLCCTTYFGTCIEYTKEVKRLCKKNNVPFELWTVWNNNYNRGYKLLNEEQFVRPNLFPLKESIGGHCVLPNLELFESKFTKLLKELNK